MTEGRPAGSHDIQDPRIIIDGPWALSDSLKMPNGMKGLLFRAWRGFSVANRSFLKIKLKRVHGDKEPEPCTWEKHFKISAQAPPHPSC